MARRFDKFTQAYQHSAIPFLLAEVVTNGSGQMVDLICRFANPAAAELLEQPVESLKNQRFCHQWAPERLPALAPLSDVAFSGSAAFFPCRTMLGRRLTVSCYQVMYGVCGCILQEQEGGDVRPEEGRSVGRFADCTAILELGPGGLRGLSCSRALSELAGYPHREFLRRFSDDLTPLVEPRDWPGLLQRLMDGAHAGQAVTGEFRLHRREGRPLWVSLRAEPVSTGAVAVFSAAVQDIDRQKHSEAELKQTRRELSAAQSQLRALFDHMPGCWMLVQSPPEGEESLRVSRELAELLGYSQTELQKKLLADRFWRIHADDRAEYAAALDTAQPGGQPVGHTFRIQRKGGEFLRLTASACRWKQPDGTRLLWTSYVDITRQQEAEDALRFHAELNELMLRRAGAVRIDYELRTDTAQIDGFDPEGRHVHLTLSEYRKSMADSDTIHPDFRKTVASELRSACSKPKKSVLHYLGRYLSREYRWYEMSLVSLADVRGNVYRVIANAVDVTGDRAAMARFQAWEQLQTRQGGEALASVRLDLTADRVLDAAGLRSHLLHLLLGNTAQECFLGGQSGVPEGAERESFGRLFSPDALLEAFSQGCSHIRLEHRLQAEGHPLLTVCSTAELAENPETNRVEAFYRIEQAACPPEGTGASEEETAE